MIKFSWIIVALLWVGACGNNAADYTAEGSDEAISNNYQTFGETISEDGAITLAEVMTKLATQDSIQVKFRATVENVCQTKGCWMNLVDEQTNSEPIFVQFKDYGFFMPKDCSGQEVMLEGIAYRSITSVDELRHYAEDEGMSKEEIEKITEPEEEFKLLASGVILYNGEDSKS